MQNFRVIKTNITLIYKVEYEVWRGCFLLGERGVKSKEEGFFLIDLVVLCVLFCFCIFSC